MLRRVFAVGIAGALVAGIGASVAAGGPLSGVYLCYSKFEVDPGVFRNAATSSQIGGHSTAAQLLAAGYWSPYAEKSVPTKTKIAGGWFLECNLQTSEQPVAGVLIGQRGQTFTNNRKLLAHLRPGYYPQAT